MTDDRVTPIEILLVEDSVGDARLAREALAESKLRNRLHHVVDGLDAMRFLRREPPHGAAPRPDLVLLDLNLPGMDGREVLAAIKQSEDLRQIPVVILTVSEDEADVLRSYDLHANCYITKPVDFRKFIAAMEILQTFWLNLVKLPPNRH